MMNGCKKCKTLCGVLFLVVGVLFLLRDLNVWDFWNVQWWSVLFLLMGLGSVAMCNCPDCQACCGMEEKPKKR